MPCDGSADCAPLENVRQALRSPELSFGPTTPSAPGPFQYGPVAGFDGTQYWVAWQAWDRVRVCETMGARVSVDGGVLDRSLTLLTLDGVGCANANDLNFDGRDMTLSLDFFGESNDAFSLARLAADAGAVTTSWLGQRTSVYPRTAVGPAGELLTITADGVQLRSWRRVADGGLPLSGTLIVPDTGVAPSFSEPAARSDVAWDGTHYLAVWLDERTDTGDIRGTWLDATGAIVSMPISIASGAGKQSHCRVEASGSTLLVVWQDESVGVRSRIRGSIVSFDSGAGPAFDLTTSMLTDSTRPTVAFSGSTFVVAWLDSAGELRASRVTVAGAVVDPGGVVVSDDIDFENGRVSITAGPGSQSLVVWLSSALTTVGKHLQGATPIEPVAFDLHLTARSQQNPALGKLVSGETLLAWVDDLPRGQSQLNYAFLFADGGSAPVRNALTGSLDPVSVAANGGTAWLALADDNTAQGLLVTLTGNTGPVPLASTSGRASSVITSADLGGFLTVWSDGRGAQREVFLRRTFLDGGLGPELQLTTGGGDKDSLALAVNATVALVVWGTDGSSSVDGVRLSGNVVLDSTPLHFGGNTYFSRPTVATDGTDFLVVWEEDGANNILQARLVARAGTSSPVFTVSSGPGSKRFPSASWDGTSYVVTWEADDEVFTDLYSAFVFRDGGVGPRVPLAATRGETEIMGRQLAIAPGVSWFAWSRFNPGVGSLRVHAQLIIDDAGVTDAGVMDAGVTDAGVTDGGEPDAGEPDAGVMMESDGGVTDAGLAPDGGMRPDGGTSAGSYMVGCGCTSSTPTTLGWAWVFALVLLKRTRRTSLESP